jgi:hypothetical protein
MILIIRGHIRDSFNSSKLYDYIKDLYIIDSNLKIFIHTWNIFANNISWRQIDINNTIVTEEIIYSYFGDKFKNLIKKIIIDDDSKIQIIGNLDGYINKGPMPIIGWKNYWYGKYKIIEYIKKNMEDTLTTMVINMRFDLFDNRHSSSKETYINYIKSNIGNTFTKNIFLRDQEFKGVDNIYIGNIQTMYKLIYFFYYFLDVILMKYNDTLHQEFFVYRINNKLVI